MIQHLLLMAVGAPLILLGAPAVLLKWGLPVRLRRWILGAVSRPSACWVAGTLTVIGWHIPASFELAMRSHVWNEVQHATFIAAGILFWLPIIPPWQGLSRTEQWAAPLYLFLGTLPCDVLSAFLVFSDRVVYPFYRMRHETFVGSALRDQVAAGALMWVSVTFIYLVPAVIITIRILSDGTTRDNVPTVAAVSDRRS
jgi:cytochrome c oxidase assembly factor CtaG